MTIVLFTDGGARGNPGPAGIGVAVYQSELATTELSAVWAHTLDHEDVKPIETISTFIGNTTNNQAEWKAIIAGLDWIKVNKPEESSIVMYLDSELVQRQMTGVYKVKNAELKPLFSHYKTLIADFEVVKPIHVARKYNAVADSLANEAMDRGN